MTTQVTVNPKALLALTHLANKDATRYAINGVAIDAEGRMAATDGKIAGRIGALSGPVVVIPTADVKRIAALAKAPKRGPEMAVTISAETWGPGTSVDVTAHPVDASDDVRGSLTVRTIEGNFPPVAEVYTPTPSDYIALTLDLALLERLHKTAKAMGVTAARAELSPSDPMSPVRVTVAGVEAIVMPLRG